MTVFVLTAIWAVHPGLIKTEIHSMIPHVYKRAEDCLANKEYIAAQLPQDASIDCSPVKVRVK